MHFGEISSQSSFFVTADKSGLIDLRYSFNSSMDRSRRPKSIEEVVEGAVDNIFKKYDENNNDYIDYP